MCSLKSAKSFFSQTVGLTRFYFVKKIKFRVTKFLRQDFFFGMNIILWESETI